MARCQLEVLINQPVREPVMAVNVTLLPLVPPVPDSVEAWVSRAEAASPGIASAWAQVDVARADVDRAGAGQWHTLDAIAQLSRSGSDNRTRLARATSRSRSDCS